ncbi:MAG: hypothetical protein KC493_00395 [Bacteriovoracaceae bacterium]|nr:hypothetical protein [Bacteriovoracaceae bacterium]
MKNKLIFITLFMLLASCSNLSKNFIKQGKQNVRGGYSKNVKWDSTLSFNRYSWFHELTMMFDLMIVDLDENSPFYNWLSDDEKADVANCNRFQVALLYSLDDRRISKKDLLNQFEEQGHEQLLLSHFTSNFKLHPDLESMSLQLYDIYGFCKKGIDSKKAPSVLFPGFPNLMLK